MNLATFLITGLFFVLFVLFVGVGVWFKGRGLKGPCKGTGCAPADKNEPPEHAMAPCGRSIHTPQP